MFKRFLWQIGTFWPNYREKPPLLTDLDMRRLSITVVVATLLAAFLLTTFISVSAVEAALTTRLRNADREVAHAIAIGLSRPEVRLEDAQSLIDAHFALGTYQRIRVLDADSRVLYARERLPGTSDRDASDRRLFWLWTLEPRTQLPSATALVKESTTGIRHVSVQSILTFDHVSSERWLKQLAGMMLGLGVLAAGVIVWFSRRRTQALQALENAVVQLRNSDRTSVPPTNDAELKPLAAAVQALSEHLMQRTHRAMEQIELLNRMRRTDASTGLLNRDALQSRLVQACTDLPPGGLGDIAVVRLLNLPDLNASLGRQNVDALIAQVCRQLQANAAPGSVWARLSGTDLALLPDNLTLTERPDVSQQLDTTFDGTPLSWRTDTLHFTREERAEDILRRCEMNLQTQVTPARDKTSQRDAWYERLTWAVTQHHFFLQDFRVIAASGDPFHREYYLRLPDRKHGIVHGGGTLMAWAEHLQLAAEIDLEVINLALSAAAEQDERVCINVSAAALLDPERRQSLIRDLSQSPRNSSRIDIDLNERFAFAHPEVLRAFCAALRPLDVRVGIDRLDEHAGHLGLLQGSDVQYLKISGALTSDLLEPQKGRETGRLLSELVHTAHGLSMFIIAENVSQTALVHALFDLGFDGVSGPAVGA